MKAKKGSAPTHYSFGQNWTVKEHRRNIHEISITYETVERYRSTFF